MGRDADADYRSHHETDTVIGHSLSGAIAISIERQYRKQGDNPYGIFQSKTSGAPVASVNLGNSFGEVGQTRIKDDIIGAGVAAGLAIGASIILL